MPLFRKQPFQRLHVSSDFKDDDEVFHCEVTNEIFKDYNEFCERIILCNSLIWSCSITGKTNMTYEEALQCEENAKKSLKEFPMELRIPILYLASKTNRSSLNEMVEDIYQFTRDRYFVGEMVEASFTEDSWCDCHVLQVIAPSEQQIKAFSKENIRSSQEHQYHPSAKLFRYEVEQLDCGDSDVSQLMIVEASQVRRRKQHYSKERNKIFLRQLCEQNENGIWVVKESVLQKYGISKVRFDTIFAGPPPDFASRIKKAMKHKQESIEKFLTSDVSKHRSFEKPDPLKKVNQTGVEIKRLRRPRMNGKFKEDLKAKALEQKAKRKEERVLKSERKKEEKQKLAALAAYMREWNKPREDLECEDLLPIPQPTPVKTTIPNEIFGDCVMILEFLESFNEELEVIEYFPNGFNLELLEKALLIEETSGPWSDLLQLLLSNIFKFQEGEEDEIHEDGSNLVNNVSTYEEASSMLKAIKLATIASSWCQIYQGCTLSELTLDHVTLSEILRQHLLSSGGRISEVSSKWRYSHRGGYTNLDDPALLMRINEAHILRILGHRSVCEISLDEKLKVATCLINQLLTFTPLRDAIDDRYERLHQARKELKSFLVAEQRKEREEKGKMKEREEDKEGKDGNGSSKVVTRNCDDGKRKEESENKLKELQLASRDDKMMLYLGADRAHRRYWRFLSIPGLFVENDEWWPGNCLPEGTPYQPELQDREATYAYLRNKFEDEFSDKENSFKKAKKSPKKVTFSDKNGLKSPRKDIGSRKDFKHELSDIRKKLMACTGDKECPIHRKRSEYKWSFYGNQEDIEALVNALTTRGIREGELRNNIVQEMTSLISVIEECPRHKLNPEVFSEPIKGQINKAAKKNKYENANLNFPPDMAVDNVLELTLRDYILDFEEKIKVGCLGHFRVSDRESWRKAISNGEYDKDSDKFVYSTNATELDIPYNTNLEKVKNEAKHSRPGTPDSEIGTMNTNVYKDSGKYLGPPSKNEILPDPKQQMAIKQLACVILQLTYAIEPKYFKRPLGNYDNKDKRWPNENSRDKWEQSLMASTSWSQLFVHLSTAENSIAWGRSAFNAQCRICRKRRDAENMLLCDGCNKGHHLYCLKPKLTAVPDGDWFCVTCKPPVKSKDKIKKRKKFEDDLEEIILTKETRHNRAKRIPESEDEDQEDDTVERDTDDDISSQQMNVCSTCRSGGKLLNCDTCSNFYHIECIEPPLSRAPRGRWSCVECKERRRNTSKLVRGRERERDKERLCAAAARSRIHGFAKSLLTTESTDWDDSSTSDDTEPRQTRRAAKRAAEVELEEDKGTIKGCMTKLQELLSDIKHHRDSWPFLSPVTKDEVPDYHDIITNPMDFGTIQCKLTDGEYETLEQFFTDCRLVFENCQAYNEEHSSVYKAGMRLLKYFEKRCKELGVNYDDEPLRPPNVKRRKIDENGLDDSEDEDTEHQKRR